MRLKWFPWTWLVRRAARQGGFLDPVAVIDRLRRFSQPSEVMEPVELLRAGLIFHARGLINSRAIQHNLDWVWPYWAERQFDPTDDAFLPRAFNITHVNLTHRNWTALGVPGAPELALVDPRGLVTPLYDGWSLDAWLLADDGRTLFPSRAADAGQSLAWEGNPAVVTEARSPGLSLRLESEALPGPAGPACALRVTAAADGPAWVVIALRPCNPEGVSFIHTVERLPDEAGWRVNGRDLVYFGSRPDRQAFSEYDRGDILHGAPSPDGESGVRCEVGMATAAAFFRVEPGRPRDVEAVAPMRADPSLRPKGLLGPEPRPAPATQMWTDALKGAAALRVPDPLFRFLYEAALRSLVLHSPGEVYPGPYTYKRFWFRDAAFILEALFCAGLLDRGGACLATFFPRQRRDGYFLSQEGEWDSNGEALWTLDRYGLLSGRPPDPGWRTAVEKGAAWIRAKRIKKGPQAGLFPPGFSAEHLGPNDYYYWDDFWGVAGFASAANLLEKMGEPGKAASLREESRGFLRSIEENLLAPAARLGRPVMPAAPGRRMDAGAIGSLVASYPLRVLPAADGRLAATADFLMDECLLKGAFFQGVVHSGINAYLTLHLAQVLLRAGDGRFFDLVRRTAELASPTGQWPEAVHPRTGGGCMGDGQHAWASAEWVMMMRNMFVREEEGALVLASGLPPAWRREPGEMSFGPAPTPHGPVTVTVRCTGKRTAVSWTAAWRGAPPRIEVRLPGLPLVAGEPGDAGEVVQEEAP